MCLTTGVTTGAKLNVMYAAKPLNWGIMTMIKKRLIDANALIEQFDESIFEGFVMKRLIEMQPTVDAVEVVHGRWIPSKSMALSDKCSVCHGWVTRHSVNERKFNYCPNCGAKMDGDG